MLPAMRRGAPRVVNHLPRALVAAGWTFGELARRTLLPARRLAHLREADANPPLAVAERVAAALDVPVEHLWTLHRGGHRR
jgi:hypothetical protein